MNEFKKKRLELGLSQYQFAQIAKKIANIGSTGISNAENNRSIRSSTRKGIIKTFEYIEENKNNLKFEESYSENSPEGFLNYNFLVHTFNLSSIIGDLLHQLNWNDEKWDDFIHYKKKITIEERTQLAQLLHVNKSKLILYQPSQKIIDTYNNFNKKDKTKEQKSDESPTKPLPNINQENYFILEKKIDAINIMLSNYIKQTNEELTKIEQNNQARQTYIINKIKELNR